MSKRLFDILGALLGLTLALPIMPFLALGIKLDSPGPILIAVPRVGQGGKIFAHYRFRTMAGDPLRKTRFGRFMGNRSLDDIPTLFNVLRGDLSLVGPRPEAPDRVDLTDPEWQSVLSVKPGLTGLGLLTFNEQYNQTAVKTRIQPEIYYAEHSSLRFDLRLLGRTFAMWLKMGHIKGRM
jgi:lipopolysaccharide/colanic/teichoic acid biosynthesis glycosyltransferase